jgi:hypothetical protein
MPPSAIGDIHFLQTEGEYLGSAPRGRRKCATPAADPFALPSAGKQDQSRVARKALLLQKTIADFNPFRRIDREKYFVAVKGREKRDLSIF